MNICWLSAGVSSFIAAYLIKDELDPEAGRKEGEILEECSLFCREVLR